MGTPRDDLDAAPLGHATSYPETYDPGVLFPVPRHRQREAIGIVGAALPFTGVDLWTAFELTWLDLQGKPVVAIARLAVPIDSPAIIESKSMKLYLGSFAQSRFADPSGVRQHIERDLTARAGARVDVELVAPANFDELRIVDLAGESLDTLPIAFDQYEVDARLLATSGPTRTQTLRTDLFRSVCPVTGQPDYASLSIGYRGPAIDRAGLLRYLVSYRAHAGFHEHCVERIFVDILAACGCAALTVHARFTRRGGIDINPFRTNANVSPAVATRAPRQ